MSSRLPPPPGLSPRDRSPRRFGDRRPPAGPRGSGGSDDGHPPYLAREPPRGPKALVDPPRPGAFGGRCRGYTGRGDFRDRDRDIRDRDRDHDVRDHRDFRDGPLSFRRDVDRDWGRRERDFDSRDSRIGPRRGHSRSPPPAPRDFRIGRESTGRDFDLIRMRRNSRDSVHSSSSIPDGPPPSVGHHPRGGPIRGRGRGRGSYLDGRDSFQRRSGSRDGRWDLERERIMDRDRDRVRDRDRDLDRDRDRDFDRERGRDLSRRGSDRRDLDRRGRFGQWDELDRRFDRDDRDAPGDHWDNSRPVIGIDSRVPTSPYQPLPSISSVSATSDRFPDRPPPGLMQRGSLPGSSLDPDRWETQPNRSDSKDFPPSTKSSPPPSAPQVPAFGSVTALIPGLPQKPPPDIANTGLLSIKAEKLRAESPTRGPVQPPTGPKAERFLARPPLSDPRLRREEGPEPPGRLDLASRISKSPFVPGTGAIRQPLDGLPPTAPAAMNSRDSPATNADAQAASNVGPTSFSLDVGKTPSSARQTSVSPQTSPSMQVSGIPTGPRALQQRPPASRTSPKINKPWIRSSYGRAPSLPDSAANTDRMLFEAKGRSLSASENLRPEPRLFDDSDLEVAGLGKPVPKVEKGGPMPTRLTLREDDIRDGPQHGEAVEAAVPKAEELSSVEEGQDTLMPDFMRSSDEEDEDERIVFTQDYLEERKQIFERDVEALRVGMPPPPLEDPNVVAMLVKIQLLGLVANDMTAGSAADIPADGVDAKAPTASLSTTLDYRSDKEAEDKCLLTGLVSKGPTVEDLPFLNNGPPTPISDLEVYQENAANHERFKEVFRTELMRRRKRSALKNASLRDDYISLYKPWRLDVWEQDRSKGKHQGSPDPASPPAPPIAPTPPSIVEGRRFKGNSELDFQNALRASEISAQEELERRRGNKATAQPDLTREAVVPDMLEPHEAKCRIYKDSNNIVDTEKALSVFGFLPPVNDFTPEEHERFTNAFMAHPKRWGKIAESLPGRDFQECIVHYYLTKEEIKYKAKLNKRWSRRGRAKRSARPKSNALMADLGVVKPDYEGEEEPPAVTDTGRPRRAAAPTFGDTAAEADHSSNGRRTNSGKDGELGEKPVSRRGARGGPGSRGGRRGRAAQLQQQPQLPTEQQMPNVSTMSGTLFPRTEREPSLDGTAEGASLRVKEASEREPSEALPRVRAGRGRTREGMYVFESMEPDTAAPIRPQEMGYGSLQPTSYWSVPEQRDFPLLLAHFGRDFEGISNFMKTKTTVMVKNYFQRRIDSGQTDFEDIVQVAEGKKASGEPTGPLPVPSVAPKRRYEATPSAIVPRPLAPHTETAPDLDESRLASKTKPAVLSPQQVPLHARIAPDRERNAPRYPPLAQASSPPMSAPMSAPLLLNEDPSRVFRPHMPIQNRLQGPRLGYFTEERPEALATYSVTRPQEPPIPPRQPVSPVDAVRIESLRTSTADIRGSPLLSSQHIISSSQQGYMQSQAQQSIMVASHSRRPSLTQTPSSPAQHLLRQEADVPPIRRDSMGQRQLFLLSGQPVDMPPPSPAFSPARETSRTGSTATEPREAPRQVPAKRSNIMNILNDEPEEPQPRKKFASEQASPGGTAASPPRLLYSGVHPLAQPTPPLHQAESQFSASQQRQAYAQQSQYLPPPRTYTDYQGYGTVPGTSGGPPNNDWMARFDPRGQQQQQQQQPQPTQLSSRPSPATFSPYAQSQIQPGPPPANMTAPSPVPVASSASSQRAPYPVSLFAQPPNSHTQAMGASRQEVTVQNQGYRQPIGSPPQRHDSVSFGSQRETPTPIQSPGNLLSMGSHQPSLQSSYAPGVQPTSSSSHLAGHQPTGQQTYQQHVQTMVNGAHQHSSTSYADGQYGRGTPPPQSSSSRGLPGPSSLALGRSYTPPEILQGNSAGGATYAAGGPSTPGSVLLHSRRPGLLDETAPRPPAHSRMYSQGSNTGPPPGPLP